MPGVLQIEACAQVGAVAILSLEENRGKTAYFGAINNARFKRKVVPGDRLRMEWEIIKQIGPLGIGKAVATVDGETALTAELTYMIQLVMCRISVNSCSIVLLFYRIYKDGDILCLVRF